MPVQRTAIDWLEMPPPFPLWDARQGAQVSDEWTAFSAANVTMVDVAAKDSARLGGGSEAYPARVRYRVQAERPGRDDRGEVLEIIGDRFRRLGVPVGSKLWLRSDVTAMTVIVEVTGMVR